MGHTRAATPRRGQHPHLGRRRRLVVEIHRTLLNTHWALQKCVKECKKEGWKQRRKDEMEEMESTATQRAGRLLLEIPTSYYS
jgi:hypothetical protein